MIYEIEIGRRIDLFRQHRPCCRAFTRRGDRPTTRSPSAARQLDPAVPALTPMGLADHLDDLGQCPGSGFLDLPVVLKP